MHLRYVLYGPASCKEATHEIMSKLEFGTTSNNDAPDQQGFEQIICQLPICLETAYSLLPAVPCNFAYDLLGIIRDRRYRIVKNGFVELQGIGRQLLASHEEICHQLNIIGRFDVVPQALGNLFSGFVGLLL